MKSRAAVTVLLIHSAIVTSTVSQTAYRVILPRYFTVSRNFLRMIMNISATQMSHWCYGIHHGQHQQSADDSLGISTDRCELQDFVKYGNLSNEQVTES